MDPGPVRRRINPVGSRLAFVERQFPADVAEWVVDTVLAVASDGPVEDALEPWEDQIPDLASSAAKIFKGVRRDRLSAAEADLELERLAEDFFDLVAGYDLVAAVGPALTPKEVRQKVVAGELRGFEIVADLGEGYTAVVATPDLASPLFPHGDPEQPPQAMVEWVEAYAPFQQYMGVAMNNCLQLYRVNYVPYGKGKFGVQRRGGKLYAVLDPRAQPVAATLTDSQGTVIETNGRNNKPPRGADGLALDRFEALMGWNASERGVFDVPGANDHIVSAIEWVLDVVYEDGPDRNDYLDRATTAARQDGFDGARVIRAWMIYILIESPYSAMRSAEASGYALTGDVVEAIEGVANALRSGDTAGLAVRGPASMKAREATWGAQRVPGSGAVWSAVSAGEAAVAAAGVTHLPHVGYQVVFVVHEASSAVAHLQPMTTADPWGAVASRAARTDYADKLLELMEAEARDELEDRADNPRQSNALKRRLMP